MLYRSKATSNLCCGNSLKLHPSSYWTFHVKCKRQKKTDFECMEMPQTYLQNPLEPGSGLDSRASNYETRALICPSSPSSKPPALNWKSKDKFDPQYELQQGQQLVTRGFELAVPQVFQAVIPAIERIPAHRTLVRCFGRCGKIPKRELRLSVQRITDA